MTCEREGCGHAGRIYYKYGRCVSTGPHTYGSGAEVFPDQPITLCSEHSLEAFGVAFL